MVKNSTLHFWQTSCILPAKKRGFHLISENILEKMSTMPSFQIGLVHLFLQHTSASLTISENTCSEVRQDLETYFSTAIPDDKNRYQHSLEGEDDMPAHLKNVLLGCSLTIPLQNGQLALGQWQGIYLCEHRNHASARQIIITAQGDPSLCV